MRLVDGREEVILSLTRAELLLLSGSVNEAIEAVEDWESPTRLGAEKGTSQQLRADLQRVIADFAERQRHLSVGDDPLLQHIEIRSHSSVTVPGHHTRGTRDALGGALQ